MKENGTKKGRRIARRYSLKDRERLFAEHLASGLTKKAFCEQKGINAYTFYGWTKNRLKPTKKCEFARVEVQMAPRARTHLEVVLTNGVRLNIDHEGEQKELIGFVRGVAGC